MPDLELTQPQFGETAQEAGQEGAESPQPKPEPVAEEQPGAEKEAAKPPAPTYTEEQWRSRESAKDREVAEARKQTALLAQQLQQADLTRRQAEEATAQAQERQAVEQGQLTQEEADQRKSLRAELQRQRQELAQGQVAYQGIMAEAEKVGRIMAAQDFAKKYEVEAAELLNDASLTNPGLMELKARELQLNKRESALRPQGESFDGGQVGSAGANTEKMTPEEKIAWGLSHPPRKTR